MCIKGLSEDMLAEVAKHLGDKFYEAGLLLGVRPYELDAIEVSHWAIIDCQPNVVIRIHFATSLSINLQYTVFHSKLHSQIMCMARPVIACSGAATIRERRLFENVVYSVIYGVYSRAVGVDLTDPPTTGPMFTIPPKVFYYYAA